MKLSEWLIELANNNRVEMINGEICILPILESEDEQ